MLWSAAITGWLGEAVARWRVAALAGLLDNPENRMSLDKRPERRTGLLSGAGYAGVSNFGHLFPNGKRGASFLAPLQRLPFGVRRPV